MQKQKIRKSLVERDYTKGIISLPANLFYGTGIPACIIVLDKEGAEDRKHIFMVDASKGFIKDGNKNRLREQDIHKIVDYFNKQIEFPKFSKRVSFKEISDPKNDYNLNIPRYIDSQESEDSHDTEAHLLGGVTRLKYVLYSNERCVKGRCLEIKETFDKPADGIRKNIQMTNAPSLSAAHLQANHYQYNSKSIK